MAPTSKLSLGIKRASRSHAYHRRGLWAIKAKHGGAFPKAEKPAAAAEPKFYPADDVKPRAPSTRKPKQTKLRHTTSPLRRDLAWRSSSPNWSADLIEIGSSWPLQVDHHARDGADPARGTLHGEESRVSQAAQVRPAPCHRSFFSFYCSGPFKINGVPIRRVNQTYVIATSTKVDISGVDVSKYDDKYFARDKKKKVKKTEGELFDTEKEAAKSLPDFKKDDQKAVDAALIKAIESVPDLKTYLGARFSLRDGDKPHEMVF
ncbi:hypothetical protein EJB05_21023, partial [Eragrostis curvula]